MVDKRAVSRMFYEIGTLLELKGENRFKCIAYQNAARN
ncbi:MAG: DNA polymerase III, partial [Ignavibacteriales bacterium]|nr:DNA polymerase III [Ignavibacteriales bacterium]